MRFRAAVAQEKTHFRQARLLGVPKRLTGLMVARIPGARRRMRAGIGSLIAAVDFGTGLNTEQVGSGPESGVSMTGCVLEVGQ